MPSYIYFGRFGRSQIVITNLFVQESREYDTSDCDMLCRVKLEKKLKHRSNILENLRKRFRTEYLG